MVQQVLMVQTLLGQNAGLFATGALIQMSLDNLLDNLRQMLMLKFHGNAGYQATC
jgi:hypothetical protein